MHESGAPEGAGHGGPSGLIEILSLRAVWDSAVQFDMGSLSFPFSCLLC